MHQKIKIDLATKFIYLLLNNVLLTSALVNK